MPNRGTNAERGRRAAKAASQGKQAQAHKPTGQQGEDERTRAALHVSGYHTRRQTE